MPRNKQRLLKTDYSIIIDWKPDGARQVRYESDPGDTPEVAAQGQDALSQAIAALGNAVEREEAGGQVGITLKDAVDAYLAGADVKGTTLKNYRSYLHNQVLPHFGSDRPLASIAQLQFAGWVQQLSTLGRSASTLEGYLSALTALGNWHRARGQQVPPWTARTLLPAARGPASVDRPAHTVDELRIIFAAVAADRHKRPEEFWATVATAFMGCRVEELAQVNLRSDFAQHHRACITSSSMRTPTRMGPN
jgi:hypothetical protein